ncbi:disease resistance protein [Spatholobus suberectus]|nr:disease resistance protein [Spatholobus suberectus]
MDAVVSATTESALQIGGGVVKRQVGYFYSYNDKLKEVKHYIEMLDNARKRIQIEVNDAKMNAEEIEDDVQHWLNQVDEKIKKYECFIHDERHVKTRCSIGFFPNNLQLRYRLGRNATKMVEEIKADELWNKRFDKVSYRVCPSMDVALSNTGYESFGSRNKTLEKIMKTLEDSTVNMIGVYGVGGVGKTTLVKEVAKKAQEKKLFNMVVMANITRNPNIKEIQGQIAEMLGMRLEEESEIVRADRIRKRLKKEKENTLIILDDLWNGLDMKRLGIPCSDDEDGSQQDVKDFGYNKIEKEKLSIDFNKLKTENLSVDFSKLKTEKLSGDHKGCKILLTSRSKEVLCNQMDVREGSTFLVGVLDEQEAEILLKKVAGIHVTNSVFDVKSAEIAKMCAGLPIALVSIGRALKNKSSFVWEDVCRQIRRQNFTEGQESIEFSVKLSYDHLKNEELKCIFLHCARMGNDPLLMDLVKFCIGLGLLQGVHTIKEARYRVNVLIEELKASSLLVESYSIDRFNIHDIVRDVALSISSKEKHVLFMKNGILDEWPRKDELESIQYIIKSMELAFPKLESMCLYNLENLEKICQNQLTEASFCNLKIIKIKTCDQLENLFPFSMVRLLTMLETIEVRDCGSLKEIVSVERQTHTISDDRIEFSQLRLLTLQCLPAFACLCTNDKMPSGAQSLEDQGPNKNKDITCEVAQGAMGACLSLFNEKVSIPKLERLELSSINILRIWSDQSLHCFQNLLTLNVTDCGNLKYLMSLSMAGSLVNLHTLFVSACEMMEDLFRPEDTEKNIDIFPKLKKMEIICMERLYTIWQPQIGLHSFCSLDFLIVRECHKLVTIFPSYLRQRFQSLQSLTITNCNLVENIFDFRNISQTCDSRTETNLHNVFLEELPNLVHVWKDDTSEILKYNNLQRVCVYECPYLKYLFPLSVANDIEKLEVLEVWQCEALKEIVAWDKGSNANAITFKFPHLNAVSFMELLELRSFYWGTHSLEWPLLKKLLIVNCCKLEGLTTEITNSQVKPIVLATEKVIYNLEEMAMSLKEAKWLQKYIISVHRMHKLQRLVLYRLKNTEFLFWFLHRLPNLKSLTLDKCHINRIWAPGSLISHEKIGVVMQLKELELANMFNLEEIGFEHDPLLQRVQCLVIDGSGEKDKWYWEGDLNDTLQKLFTDQVSLFIVIKSDLSSIIL